MTDLLLQSILNNLLIASMLAAIALLVQRSEKYVSVANLLWILVLLKLVTPPIFTIKLIPISKVARSSVESVDKPELIVSDEPLTVAESLDQESELLEPDNRDESLTVLTASLPASVPTRNNWPVLLAILGWVWLVGCFIIATFSTWRIVIFSRLLRRFGRPAEIEMVELVSGLCKQFGLRTPPEILVTAADISPFVWWTGWRSKIVLPEKTVRSLTAEQIKMVLAHEIAHLYRKDHWVRWLEFVAGVVLWWNPLMWWSRKQLRMTEELSCDALVIQKTKANRHQYASSLVNVAESLAESAIRPPSVASAMTSGGELEKRLKMIVSNRRVDSPGFLRLAMLIVALGLFPVGLIYGQDFGAVERRLAEAVKEGELSEAQMSFMMQALELSMRMQEERHEHEEVHHEKREMEERREFEERRVREREMFEREMAERELIRRRREFGQIEEELMMAVRRGKLSQEEAEEKLDSIRRDLFGNRERNEEQEEREAFEREMMEKRREFGRIERELAELVEAGEISREEAGDKLRAVKEEFFGNLRRGEDRDEVEEREMAERKERFAQVERELDELVEREEISAEDAERKLMAIRREWFGGNARERNERQTEREEELEKRKWREREARFDAIMKRVELAVREERLSKGEAKEILANAKRELFDRDRPEEYKKIEARYREVSELEIANRKRKFEAVARELKEAVEADKLSEEEAKEKLEGLRRELFGKFEEEEEEEERVRDRRNQRRREMKSREMEIRKRRFEAAVREIKEAVEEGDLSEEEAEEKIDGLRRRMEGKRERE